ncbi:hypothetical protein V6R86_05120 [Sphingomonas kaistensis]|uniref:Exo-alpha-sialidase n=1 Tax=Sphingomonas kaistensis TaxID=298708 RepID=A0ABZ2FZ27_9SPHN
MDRRTALKGMIGAAGAGATFGCGEGMLTAGNAADLQPAAPAQPPLQLGPVAGFKAVSLAQVPIGAGGFVTGIEISADGEFFACRTDVGNAYVRRRSDKFWMPLFTTDSMEAKEYDPLPDAKDKADGLGVAGIRLAPSDKNVIYASFQGSIWRSADGGRTIRRTALRPVKMLANTGWQRLFNPAIDVHPKIPSSVIVGTWGEGVWYTADSGVTWRSAAVPAAGAAQDGAPGLYLVLFDPGSPDTVYVFVTGLGLFRSTTGPAGQFESLSGGPRYSSNIVASADGSIYVCEFTKETVGGLLWRFKPGAGWSSGKGEQEAFVVAVDPARPERLLAIAPYGATMQSEDYGATFSKAFMGKWAEGGGEIRWMGGLTMLFPAQVRFDPREPNRAWIAQGVGVARADVDRSRGSLTDWSAGIEELCTTSVLCVPGGKTYLSAWDKSFWRVDSLTSFSNDFRYPVTAGGKHTTDLVAFASSIDFAPEDPNFLVGVIAPSDKSAPGYTADGGRTWQAFSNAPDSGWGNGGCIAAGSRTNIVLLPSNNAAGVFTLDGGRSWSPIKLDGSNPTTNFANAFYVARKNISADKTRPGTFALVYTTVKDNEYTNPLGGLWLTRDGGRSWTRQATGVIGAPNIPASEMMLLGMDPRQFWQCQLEYVPGRSGELVYTPHADFPGDRFYWSKDDGKTWSQLHPSIRNVTAFGFSKAAPGQSRPALFFWGEVKKQKGLFVSIDWFATEPKLLTRFPSRMLAGVTCIAGDPDRFGRAYVGTNCAGWVRVDLVV